MKTPIVIFVRVSRKEQNYDRQVSELQAYAEANNMEVVETITEKISGSKTALNDRVAIARLLELVSMGKIKKVLISEVSRLGRRTKDVLEVIDILHQSKVSLVVYNYKLETLDNKGKVNPMAQFLITIIADIARMESENLSDRILSGLDEAKRKGKTLGRKEGTTKTDKQFLKENKKAVQLLKDKKQSIRNVAKLCDLSTNTVLKIKKILASE